MKLVNSNFRHLKERLQELGITERRRRAVRSRCFISAAGRSGTRIQLQQGCGARYAHGSLCELTAERSSTTGTSKRLPRILFEYGEEKFAARSPGNRTCERAKNAIRTTARLAETDQGSDPCGRKARGTASSQTQLSGDPHRCERRTRRIRGCARSSAASSASRRTNLCHNVPFFGGSNVKQIFAKNTERCTCPPDFPICVCSNQGELRRSTASRSYRHRRNWKQIRGRVRRSCELREKLTH